MKKFIFTLLLLLFIAVSAGGVYAYYVYIPEKIEKRVLEGLTSLGFETFWFEKIEHKNGGVSISNITLDKDGFSKVENITIRFSLWRLLLSPDSSQNIKITGLSLTGDLSAANKLSFSGVPDNTRLINGITSGISANMVSIENAQADILSETYGGLKVSFDGQINLENIDKITMSGILKSTQHQLGFHAKIKSELTDLKKLETNTTIEQIAYNHKDIRLKRGTAEINSTYNLETAQSKATIESQIANVNWNELPLSKIKAKLTYKDGRREEFFVEGQTAGYAQIDWNARISHTSEENNNDKIELTLTPKSVQDIITYMTANALLPADIRFPDYLDNLETPIITLDSKRNAHDTYDGEFRIFLNNPNVELRGAYKQDADKKAEGAFYIPKTNIYLEKNEDNTPVETSFFEISTSGDFVWTPKTAKSKNDFSWKIDTNVHNGTIDMGALKLPYLTGKFSENSEKKLTGVRRLPFKLPLKKNIPNRGFVELNLAERDAPYIKSAKLQIYGGEIASKTSLIDDKGKIKKSLELGVSDINLSQLFKDAGFNDVEIYGYMGGVIPMTLKDDIIEVKGGILQSQGGGVISLSDKMALALFPGSSAKMQNIRAAMKRYHYEYFEVRLDGDLAGRVMMTLNASGKNPNMDTDKPVDLNLQIETQISMLFSRLLQ